MCLVIASANRGRRPDKPRIVHRSGNKSAFRKPLCNQNQFTRWEEVFVGHTGALQTPLKLQRAMAMTTESYQAAAIESEFLHFHESVEGRASELAKSNAIVDRVLAERQAQRAQWSEQNDDKNSIAFWVELLQYQANKALRGGQANAEQRFVETAALAMAAGEAMLRKAAAPNSPVSVRRENK